MNRRTDADRPLFEPVSRLSDALSNADRLTIPAGVLADMCTSTMDISMGAGPLLKILRREALDDWFRADSDDPDSVGRPLFSKSEREYLMALAIASLDALSDRADRCIEGLEESARNQAASHEGGVR